MESCCRSLISIILVTLLQTLYFKPVSGYGNLTFCQTFPSNIVRQHYSSHSQSGVLYSPRYLSNYQTINISRGCYVEIRNIPNKSYITLKTIFSSADIAGNCSYNSKYHLINDRRRKFHLNADLCGGLNNGRRYVQTSGIYRGRNLSFLVSQEYSREDFIIEYTIKPVTVFAPNHSRSLNVTAKPSGYIASNWTKRQNTFRHNRPIKANVTLISIPPEASVLIDFLYFKLDGRADCQGTSDDHKTKSNLTIQGYINDTQPHHMDSHAFCGSRRVYRQHFVSQDGRLELILRSSIRSLQRHKGFLLKYSVERQLNAIPILTAEPITPPDTTPPDTTPPDTTLTDTTVSNNQRLLPDSVKPTNHTDVLVSTKIRGEHASGSSISGITSNASSVTDSPPGTFIMSDVHIIAASAGAGGLVLIVTIIAVLCRVTRSSDRSQIKSNLALVQQTLPGGDANHYDSIDVNMNLASGSRSKKDSNTSASPRGEQTKTHYHTLEDPRCKKTPGSTRCKCDLDLTRDADPNAAEITLYSEINTESERGLHYSVCHGEDRLNCVSTEGLASSKNIIMPSRPGDNFYMAVLLDTDQEAEAKQGQTDNSSCLYEACN